jgi:hypothetical protein
MEVVRSQIARGAMTGQNFVISDNMALNAHSFCWADLPDGESSLRPRNGGAHMVLVHTSPERNGSKSESVASHLSMSHFHWSRDSCVSWWESLRGSSLDIWKDFEHLSTSEWSELSLSEYSPSDSMLLLFSWGSSLATYWLEWWAAEEWPLIGKSLLSPLSGPRLWLSEESLSTVVLSLWTDRGWW